MLTVQVTATYKTVAGNGIQWQLPASDLTIDGLTVFASGAATDLATADPAAPAMISAVQRHTCSSTPCRTKPLS